MRKKKWGRSRRFLLFVVVFLSLAGTGATYAKWCEGLMINVNASTGIMDLRHSSDEPCYVSLIDAKGAELTAKQEADTVILDHGKTMELNVALPFFTEDFRENPDCLIKFVFPMKAGDSATVNRLELSKADFREEPEEELILRPVNMVLMEDDGQETYEISEEEAGNYNSPLKFHVFRETCKQNGAAAGVIYLRMMEESRELLASFPSEVQLRETEFLESDFHGQLMITYGFSIPVYAEQGHDDAAILREKE